MTKPVKIDFVSDISCPWCAIGLQGLEKALENLGGTVEADLEFQPFELNPVMEAEGLKVIDFAKQRFGSTPEQSATLHKEFHNRAASVGFEMNMGPESRFYNTFDAHRLLHWARLEGRQRALKHALFKANFTQNRKMNDSDVLAAAAEEAGLDPARAREILAGDDYAEDVRATERLWQQRGISSVPSIIINDRYLISGGQPVEAFEQALRTIAAEV